MAKLFLYTLILFSVTVQAQSYDKWEIYQNRKEVSSFNNKKETNDEKRVVLLNRSLEGPGFFVIEYKPAAEQAEWIRTIAFYDSTDKQIREYNNTLFLRIHNSEIADIMDGRQKVKVYSWAVPKDPAVAATVRIRRILLCTLYTR
ncbi:MAG TPA: hypothetical protein VHQ93_10135 [Chitinophagaceae bacterium]|jgi:hypothetical protein|nr:hypothetical protein [Chitinophagaceae bacterium]